MSNETHEMPTGTLLSIIKDTKNLEEVNDPEILEKIRQRIMAVINEESDDVSKYLVHIEQKTLVTVAVYATSEESAREQAILMIDDIDNTRNHISCPEIVHVDITTN